MNNISHLDKFDWLPTKANFTLKECCNLKNLNYKTSCNKTWLQPNSGKADFQVGGRKMFTRETLIKWLYQSDDELLKSLQ